MGVVLQGHVTRFLIFAPSKHIVGIGETRHFKFCMQIDTTQD